MLFPSSCESLIFYLVFLLVDLFTLLLVVPFPQFFHLALSDGLGGILFPLSSFFLFYVSFWIFALGFREVWRSISSSRGCSAASSLSFSMLLLPFSLHDPFAYFFPFCALAF